MHTAAEPPCPDDDEAPPVPPIGNVVVELHDAAMAKLAQAATRKASSRWYMRAIGAPPVGAVNSRPTFDAP